jgi:hypothetical protein
MADKKQGVYQILSVGAPVFTKTTKGGYNAVEVAYKDDGKVTGKKFLDFTNKEIYNAVQTLKQDDVVSVDLVKNDKGYWEWSSFVKGEKETATENSGEQPVVATSSRNAGTGGKVLGSTYETPAERKLRRDFDQLKHAHITRMAAFNSARELCTHNNEKVTLEEVFSVAEQVANWIQLDSEVDPQQAIINMKSDIPY